MCSKVLTRMIGILTFISYFAVGTILVRTLESQRVSINIPFSLLSVMKDISLEELKHGPILSPEIKFSTLVINLDEESNFSKKLFPKKLLPKNSVKKKVVQNKSSQKIKDEKNIINDELGEGLELRKITGTPLNFSTPIKLEPILMKNELPSNLISLFREIKDATLIANSERSPEVTDEIKTISAADSDVVFYEYPQEINSKPDALPDSKTNAKTNAKTNKIAESVKDESLEEVIKQFREEKSIQQSTDNRIVEHAIEEVEEVNLYDIYSLKKANQENEKKPQTINAVAMTTHSVGNFKAPHSKQANQATRSLAPTKNSPYETALAQAKTTYEKNALSVKMNTQQKNEENFYGEASIQIVGTNLEYSRKEEGFEIRFQDDENDYFQDYNSGHVNVEYRLAQNRMTRSLVALKRGYIPTNSDLALENGSISVSIPMLQEESFNELMEPFGPMGPVGALLVETNYPSLSLSVDVPYGKALNLDENFNITDNDEYSYRLFLGVQAGNALISFRDKDKTVASKIIHIHEHELTFETDLFEDDLNSVFSLYEEDLLSKEKAPLILLSENVRKFASNKNAYKVSDHTYKLDFEKKLIGGRSYLELTHQAEPIFIGFNNQDNITVPSEGFMRYLLSRFRSGQLDSRCMIQVNLSKVPEDFKVLSESVNRSTLLKTEVLDSDGRFYESLSEKSKKIIIVGENQGNQHLNPDSKVNIKINYIDGSADYLSSYCSPNTYLVEQL